MCAKQDKGLLNAGEDKAAGLGVNSRVVIVGAGQGGDACAAALRKLGHQGPITLVGSEPYPPYQRPPLSKTDVSSKTKADAFYFRGAGFYADKQIDLLLDTQVSQIDRPSKCVHLSSGASIAYDKLVIATGSRARQLGSEVTADSKCVQTLRTFDDARRLFASLGKAKSVLVLGAGYLGLEIAAVAAARGLSVTVAEVNNRILNRAAGADTARKMQELHQKNGVQFMFQASVARVSSLAGGEVQVSFVNGSTLLVDVCVAAIGGVPNDELAKAAGLEVDNGVLVNAFAQTSDPDIMAVGDCARLPFNGEMIRLESVQNAIEQAEIAANTILGKQKTYVPVARFWSDQFDTKLLIAGLSAGYTKALLLKGKRPGSESVWYFKDDALIAVDSINDPGSHMIARQLFADKSRQITSAEVLAAADNLRALMQVPQT